MRIVTLDLLAYGPFRGASLDFARPGLHVVLGRNEAGKSTTLRAILGLLFGIDARTTDAHVHKMGDLRVGGVLEGAGGERVRIVRRKGTANTLLDAAGHAVDDAVLRKLLGGVGRETFAHAWGLDHDRLGAGAQALLEGKGDLGESLFDASVGGGGDVQRLLKELTEEADRLYKPKASSLPLNEALKAFAEASRTVKERQSLPEAFLKQEAALADTDADRTRVFAERVALETKRARVAIARRRIPLERRRDLARAKLAEQVRIAAAATQIASLRDRQAAYQRAVEERRSHVAEVTRLGDAIEAAVRRGGIAVRRPGSGSTMANPDGSLDLDRLRLDARTERRVKTLLEARAKVTDRIEIARVEIAKQERELARITEREIVAPVHAVVLVQACSAAQTLGDLEGRIATARAKVQRAEASLAARAASTVFPGSLDDLVALPLPAVASVEALEARATEIAHRQARCAQRREDREREAATLARQIAASSGDFAPPDVAALLAARTARDEAWATFRAAPDPPHAVDVDRRLHEVDALADRMIREADRVTALARLRSEADENARQIAITLAEEDRLRTDRLALDGAHRALFADAGIEPRGFAEMTQWLDRHAQIVDSHASLREAKGEILDDEARLDHAREDLRAALGHESSPLFTRGDRLGDLVAEASARITAAEQQRLETERVTQRAAELRTSLDERAAGHERDTAARAETEAQLATLLAPLGIGSDASSEEVASAIEALRELFQLIDGRVAAEARVRTVDDEITAYEVELGAVLGACQVPSAVDLFARAKEAAEVRQELTTVEAQLEEIEDATPGGLLDAVDAEEASIREEEWEQRIDELTHEGNRLTESLGALRAGRDQMRAESQAAEAAASAQHALARVRDNVERWCRVRLASTILGREIDRYRDENQGPLLASTSALFERLTLGAYSGVRAGFDDKDRPALRCIRGRGGETGGVEVDVTGLSDGTRDQLHLSLRLASLLRRVQVAEPMPLVLDDVLIQLDDERAGAALSVLAEVARSMQVLFFTHHSRLVDVARRAVGADELVIHHLGAAAGTAETPIVSAP